MIRLIAVTLAAFYFVLLVLGDEDRRPAEVARAEPLGLRLMTAAVLPEQDQAAPVHITDISDQEAVRMAIAAGNTVRATRKIAREAPRSVLATAESEPTTTAASAGAETSYWYVTGTRVNLREGPGTSNAIVGQATLGSKAAVLSDHNGWYEIRLADGSAAGWIFGRFLNDQKPG